MKKTIYIYKSGTLMRRDNSLCLVEKNKNVHYIPIEQIDSIFCFGEITVNKRVYCLCNKYNVSIQYYNYYGHYIGRFVPNKFMTGKDMIPQIKAYTNDEKRLGIAKEITRAELANMIALMKYYGRSMDELKGIITKLTGYQKGIDNCFTINGLLMLEAEAKKCYYGGFDLILKDARYHFEKRMVQKEGNEINTMMSYGYHLLYGNFLSAIDQSPLMSNISFIHSIAKSSDSLQFDLADILKPVIVDRMVLRLARKDMIKEEYFDQVKGRCYLNKAGLTFYVSEYENVLSKTVEIADHSYSYKNVIHREVHQLYDHITKQIAYKPYIMGWQLCM